MSERLLPFYNRELDALRSRAGQFAEAYPKVAGRLRLTPDAVDDPHVERLLEGVAFLSARVQQRLDDEQPEITDALLGVLYPHYLAPVPSAAIVQFGCKPDSRAAAVVPAGTALLTDPIRGEPCRFRTCYDTTLWPVVVESVRLTGLPLTAPVIPAAKGARSSLRIVLRLADPEARFNELGISGLRFFLRGPAEQSLQLYALLCGHTVGVALANGPNDDRPTPLPPGTVQPVGFAPEQALYPWSARSFSGFRLMTEYFALPEKFLFVDLTGLDARTLVQEGDRMEIFVYFDQDAPALERRLQADCLALGCTPVVNLFRRRCEPIRLDHQRTEYPVVADNRFPGSFEIWSIEQVREMRDDGTSKPWRPFYRHPADRVPEADIAGVYLPVRRESAAPATGTEMLLAPFDRFLSVDQPAGTVLSVDALCTNRDLPNQLPFGAGQPRLHLAEGISAVTDIVCLTAPTPSWRPALREQRSWRLISHLSLGHLSMVEGDAGAEMLREVLRLYDVRDTGDTRIAIDGLVSVRAQEGTARVPGSRAGSFCRGLDVTLEFDATAWASAGSFLLASVLERFLALRCAANTFVRTTAVVQGRPGEAVRFPPRAGARVLL
jgi:type VI secretion system protein ImpG